MPTWLPFRTVYLLWLAGIAASLSFLAMKEVLDSRLRGNDRGEDWDDRGEDWDDIGEDWDDIGGWLPSCLSFPRRRESIPEELDVWSTFFWLAGIAASLRSSQ